MAAKTSKSKKSEHDQNLEPTSTTKHKKKKKDKHSTSLNEDTTTTKDKKKKKKVKDKDKDKDKHKHKEKHKKRRLKDPEPEPEPESEPAQPKPTETHSDSETQLTIAELKSLLDPYTKPELITLISTLLCHAPSLASLIRRHADEDPSHRRIFVHGLPWEATSSALESVFRKFGEIEECTVVTDKATGRSKGYGFVLYRTREGAIRALEEGQMMVGSRLVHCNLASLGHSKDGDPVSARKVYVSNVGEGVDRESFRVFFEMFGDIELGPEFGGFDKEGANGKGYALIVYKSVEGAKKALEEPFKVFDGYQLHCSKAKGSQVASGRTSGVTGQLRVKANASQVANGGTFGVSGQLGVKTNGVQVESGGTFSVSGLAGVNARESPEASGGTMRVSEQLGATAKGLPEASAGFLGASGQVGLSPIYGGLLGNPVVGGGLINPVMAGALMNNPANVAAGLLNPSVISQLMAGLGAMNQSLMATGQMGGLGGVSGSHSLLDVHRMEEQGLQQVYLNTKAAPGLSGLPGYHPYPQ